MRYATDMDGLLFVVQRFDRFELKVRRAWTLVEGVLCAVVSSIRHGTWQESRGKYGEAVSWHRIFESARHVNGA